MPRPSMDAMPAQSGKGFTLIEMLVVTALLSLVMLGLVSSFYSLAQTETRVDARLDQSSQLRASLHFLDQTAGRIVTRQRPGMQNIEESRYWFDGSAQAMRWVGIMPARYGAGGRYFFQLAVEANSFSGSGDLVIRFLPWQDTPEFPPAEQMEARVLLSNVTQLAMRYRGEDEESIAWTDHWGFNDQLPSHVMIDVATAQMVLPAKIIAMRQAGSSSRSSSQASFGGGRQ